MRIIVSSFCFLTLISAEPAATPAAENLPPQVPAEPASKEENAGHEEKPVAKTPSVVKLDNGLMKIGEVTFDPKTRQVRVPCTVNMVEGLLEYAVVHENGKIHESLLITKASALDINVAMKLLRYVASEELYAIEKERGVLTGNFPKVDEEIRKAARINVFVEWEAEGKTKKLPLADWVMHAKTTKPMPAEPWVYGGSLMYEGKFLAETNGDIASIFVSRGSLFLFPGKDNQNDDVWLAFTKRIPPQGTSVTFLIEPPQP